MAEHLKALAVALLCSLAAVAQAGSFALIGERDAVLRSCRA